MRKGTMVRVLTTLEEEGFVRYDEISKRYSLGMSIYVLSSNAFQFISVVEMCIRDRVRAHRFDGLVLLGSCDKIVPGMLMAAARLEMPAIFLNGGPMYPASYCGRHYDGNIVTEAIGWKQQGRIDEEEFRHIEDIAEPLSLIHI